MHVPLLLGVFIAAVSAVPLGSQRIVGGSVTTINNYPTIVAVLYTWDGVTFTHNCGGTILNQRSVLSAAHCFVFGNVSPAAHRFRAGSTWANSGGIVYNIQSLIIHPSFSTWNFDSDIAIMRSATTIVYSNVISPAPIASATYDLRDNEVVWAAGWGAIYLNGPWSEQLRHVQIWTINQQTCRQNYANRLTDNMLCVGWFNVGGRDQCSGDSGGPLYHNGVVVGVCSFGDGCGHGTQPSVNVRVSRFTAWIQANT